MSIINFLLHGINTIFRLTNNLVTLIKRKELGKSNCSACLSKTWLPEPKKCGVRPAQ